MSMTWSIDRRRGWGRGTEDSEGAAVGTDRDSPHMPTISAGQVGVDVVRQLAAGAAVPLQADPRPVRAPNTARCNNSGVRSSRRHPNQDAGGSFAGARYEVEPHGPVHFGDVLRCGRAAGGQEPGKSRHHQGTTVTRRRTMRAR